LACQGGNLLITFHFTKACPEQWLVVGPHWMVDGSGAGHGDHESDGANRQSGHGRDSQCATRVGGAFVMIMIMMIYHLIFVVCNSEILL